MTARLGGVLLLLGLGCSDGLISGGGSVAVVPPPPETVLTIPTSTTGVPRLSRREIDATLLAVFGIEGAAARTLPADPQVATNTRTNAQDEVFDTVTTTKIPNLVFVEGLAELAFEVARDVSADSAKLATLAGCAPSGASDTACLTQLVQRLGLRLWRRPMEPSEVDAVLATATPFDTEGGYALAARAAIQSLLQHPEFVYRSELGLDAGNGVRQLNNSELLSRMAYVLWGAPPTEALLTEAAGPLFDDAKVSELAHAMLLDPRATAQARTFHKLWLRYDALLVNDVTLAAAMRAESDALLDRVLSPTASVPWSELFTSTQTYLTPALATHYGLAAPARPGWVTYDDTERAGVLSHGSFLSLSSTRGDETLPSRRGAMLARRVLCQTILPPPPTVDIAAGVEVAPGACKAEAYAAHRSPGSCAGCHAQIDPLGFGFERLDGWGRVRLVERDNASCSISGAGTASGRAFVGARQFAQTIAESGDLQRCGVQQLTRFTLRAESTSVDPGLTRRLEQAFVDSGQRFDQLLLAVVLDPSFRYRKEAP